MPTFFSVIILNYNYAHFLAVAIESALAQGVDDFEVVVVDDGSTDNSREVIASYGGRVVPVYKQNGGLASSYNAGFAHSRGEVICFLDADDLFLPEKLSALAEIYQSLPEIGWLFHQMRLENEKGIFVGTTPNNPEGMADLRARMVSGGLVAIGTSTSGMTFRRNLLSQILPMPEIKNSAFDDNFLKLGAYALAPGCFTNRQLTIQRIHGNNAYSLNPKNRIDRAKRTILGAYWLKKRFPQTASFADRQMAKGLAYQSHAVWRDPWYDAIVQEYLGELSTPGRFWVRGLSVYYFLTKRQNFKSQMEG